MQFSVNFSTNKRKNRFIDVYILFGIVAPSKMKVMVY